MEKVSIIVPIYNAELYLEDCIMSIINQTYPNIELILVNDGSRDGSEIICLRYAEKDSRIKYIKQLNAGVSAARNKGIENAEGFYVSFVDSDDKLENDAINQMVKTIQQKNADVVITGYKKDYVNRTEDVVVEEIQVDGNAEIIRYFEKHFREGIASSVWGKLYKKDLISNNFDESMTMGEDLVFNICYFSRIKRIITLNAPIYLYNQMNDNSLVRSIKLDKYQQTVKSCKAMLLWLKNMNYKADECNNAYYKIADNFYSFVAGMVSTKTNVRLLTGYLEELRVDKTIEKAIRVANSSFRSYHRLLFKLFLRNKFWLCVLYLRVLTYMK